MHLHFGILLLFVSAALAVPGRIRERYKFADNTVTKIHQPTNPKYASDLFAIGTSGKVSLINGGNLVTLIDLASKAASPPTQGVIGSIAVHPSKDKVYISMVSDFASPAEQSMYSKTVNGQTYNAVWMGKVSEYNLSSTAIDNEKNLISFPVYDAATVPVPALGFGADGFLYIGVSNSMWRDTNNLKDPAMIGAVGDNFHGKVLRIDVDGTDKDSTLAYGIPLDNPRRNIAGVRGEIFATGFHSPSALSWVDGKLSVVDVNEGSFVDEYNLVSNDNSDYGFNVVVAEQCYLKDDCEAKGVKPKFTFNGRVAGVATASNKRRFVATTNSVEWFSTESDESGSVSLRDEEGYSVSTRFPSIVFTDLQRLNNGDVYLVGNGQSQQTMIFSLTAEEETPSISHASVTMYFSAIISVAVAIAAILL